MMADALLSVRDLNVAYGEVQVLWDVSLDIFAGEIVALVGANGAGKSTLLSTISGLLQPRSGTIDFAGQALRGAPTPKIVELGLAHVPEGRRLFPSMSVRDQLLLGGFRRTDRKAVKQDLERVLEIFPRLRSKLDNLGGHLSGGEQQMVAIARGVMARPKLLMIDELSLGLAPKVVDSLGEALRRIKDEGLSLLLVEQDVATAFELTARGIVLDSGRVRISGPTSELAVNPMVQQAYMGIV
jgi:branched-chain amino acid transport system ATP-binding protein